MANDDRCLRNIGPKSWRMLEAAGIRSADQLRLMGAIAAYIKVKETGGTATLNLLWALEGALTNRDWKQVAREERMSLLVQLDDIERS